MNFKAQVGKDLEQTFQNLDEFAEILHFHFDGEPITIKGILDTRSYIDRDKKEEDHMDPNSIFAIDKIAYVQLKDMKRIPRKGMEVELRDELYTIEKVEEDMGELAIYLKAIEE